MKQFKAKINGLILTILPFNSAYAIAGFGLQLGQSMFSVDASYPETGSEYTKNTKKYGKTGFLDFGVRRAIFN